jgi:hypothetical protein
MTGADLKLLNLFLYEWMNGWMDEWMGVKPVLRDCTIQNLKKGEGFKFIFQLKTLQKSSSMNSLSRGVLSYAGASAKTGLVDSQ